MGPWSTWSESGRHTIGTTEVTGALPRVAAPACPPVAHAELYVDSPPPTASRAGPLCFQCLSRNCICTITNITAMTVPWHRAQITEAGSLGPAPPKLRTQAPVPAGDRVNPNAVRILDRVNLNWISRLRLLATRTLASRGPHLPRSGGIDHNARLAVDLSRAPTSFVRP
jgi:hypothetical protein